MGFSIRFFEHKTFVIVGDNLSGREDHQDSVTRRVGYDPAAEAELGYAGRCHANAGSG